MKKNICYIAHGDGKRDCRYSVTHEHTGGQAAKYVARFCGEFIVTCDDAARAWQAAERHARGRGFGGQLVV